MRSIVTCSISRTTSRYPMTLRFQSSDLNHSTWRHWHGCRADGLMASVLSFSSAISPTSVYDAFIPLAKNIVRVYPLFNLSVHCGDKVNEQHDWWGHPSRRHSLNCRRFPVYGIKAWNNREECAKHTSNNRYRQRTNREESAKQISVNIKQPVPSLEKKRESMWVAEANHAFENPLWEKWRKLWRKMAHALLSCSWQIPTLSLIRGTFRLSVLKSDLDLGSGN